MEQLIFIAWHFFGMYMTTLVVVIADLVSGVRKAIKAGIARTSYGYRRTIDKLLRYYGTAFVFTAIDCLQMFVINYFITYHKKDWIMFPFLTSLYTVCVILIEVKSIYEKSEDKARFQSITNMAGKIVTNVTDKEAIVNAVMDYMGKPDTKPVTVEIEVKKEGTPNTESIKI